MKLRAFAVPVAGLVLVLTGVLAFGDLNGNLVYYLTPTEAAARRAELDEQRFRLAGQVVPGSVREDGEQVRFRMHDGGATVEVAHAGVPPQLFDEGIEIVVEGAWNDAVFSSDTMMVKHDEQYYPPVESGSGP